MERYYNAGYFLIKKELFKDKEVYSCSDCINTQAFGSWALSWVSVYSDQKNNKTLKIDKNIMKNIQKWTDDKFNKNLIDLGCVLPNLKMAVEFKELFYKGQNDIEILSIDFSQTERNNIIADFAPNKNTDTFNFNNGRFGLAHNLLQKLPQTDDTISEFLGFDFVGVECDSSFHSFYCHNLTEDLTEKFGLKLNKYGLFCDGFDFDVIKEYLNNEQTGLAPVPWYIVKVKKIKEDCV